MRTCNKCRKTLPISEFHKHQYTCKECSKIIRKEKYQKNKEKERAKGKAWYKDHKNDHKSLKRRYATYQNGAKSRGIKFYLTIEQFDEITGQACAYCGSYSDEYNGIPYSGVDRVDSSKDYTIDNCVPCCSMCNRMKNDYDTKEWISHMKKVIEHIG